MERAHQRGYRPASPDAQRKSAPYQTLNQRSQWLGGWREAMADG
ncbi:ribosome modulation factor [Shigella sonnei]